MKSSDSLKNGHGKVFFLLQISVFSGEKHFYQTTKTINIKRAQIFQIHCTLKVIELSVSLAYTVDIQTVSIWNIRNFVSISSLTGECAAEKLKNFCSSSLWTCLHHMVILRSQNKITDFFMILAWASPFNPLSTWAVATTA